MRAASTPSGSAQSLASCSSDRTDTRRIRARRRTVSQVGAGVVASSGGLLLLVADHATRRRRDERAVAFPRTTSACPDCVRCCHDQPGSLAPGDLDRIAAHLQQPVRVVLAKLWASPGALLANSRTGDTLRVGTITPKLRHGRCVFLDESDRCTIHPVAPFGCAYFDTHMAEKGQARSLWLVRQQASEAY